VGKSLGLYRAVFRLAQLPDGSPAPPEYTLYILDTTQLLQLIHGESSSPSTVLNLVQSLVCSDSISIDV
jgi:hypothetical protein